MRQALEVIGFILAVVAVLATVLSAVRSVVLPRAVQSVIPRLTTNGVRSVLRLWARRVDTFKERDRIMAMLAPVALVGMIVSWMLVIFVAYAVMYFAVTGRSIGGSFELSGASLATLGTTSDDRLFPALVTYSEAALALLLVALFITYFPSIYSAFTRRERGVTFLHVRAGNPPQATTMLIRYHRIEERLYQLKDLWREWEAWFNDIEESHTTFPVLAYFRSPQPDRSWVTAAGTLLDTASFWVGCIEHPPDPDAQLCIRAGFLALRRIAAAFSIPFDPDPDPEAPITIDRKEWDDAMAEMEEAGVPLRADREQAWTAWRGWRVNYDEVLLNLAQMVEAPPAPWVSDRSPIGHQGRRAYLRSARTAISRPRWPARSQPRR
jgi:hypothetical protein